MPQQKPDSLFRSTAVLTARGGELRYFSSPDQVPADLRRDMERSMRGELTATIVLADEGGQQYLRQRTSKEKESVRLETAWRHLIARQFGLEVAAAAAFAIAIWLLATLR
jgi:hypothetical protein